MGKSTSDQGTQPEGFYWPPSRAVSGPRGGQRALELEKATKNSSCLWSLVSVSGGAEQLAHVPSYGPEPGVDANNL